jgi:hypothetical protein
METQGGLLGSFTIGASSGVNTNSVETVNSIDYDDGYCFSELFKHRVMTKCRTREI